MIDIKTTRGRAIIYTYFGGGGSSTPLDGTYMLDSYGNRVKDSYGADIPLPPGKTD